jgi:regulator of protease activity HflC (stomatin/prohibitin superfamily)
MGTDAIGGLVMVAIFAFLVLGLVALAKGARTVKQYEKGLITRLGKYHGMAPSGLTFIVPFVDDIVRVDMREQVITVPPQKLITKDNVTVEVDAVVYYKVIDPVKSQYEVPGFRLRVHDAGANEPAQPYRRSYTR